MECSFHTYIATHAAFSAMWCWLISLSASHRAFASWICFRCRILLTIAAVIVESRIHADRLCILCALNVKVSFVSLLRGHPSDWSSLSKHFYAAEYDLLGVFLFFLLFPLFQTASVEVVPVNLPWMKLDSMAVWRRLSLLLQLRGLFANAILPKKSENQSNAALSSFVSVCIQRTRFCALPLQCTYAPVRTYKLFDILFSLSKDSFNVHIPFIFQHLCTDIRSSYMNCLPNQTHTRASA